MTGQFVGDPLGGLWYSRLHRQLLMLNIVKIIKTIRQKGSSFMSNEPGHLRKIQVQEGDLTILIMDRVPGPNTTKNFPYPHLAEEHLG